MAAWSHGIELHANRFETLVQNHHAATEPIQVRPFQQNAQLPLQPRGMHHVVGIHARDVAAAGVGCDQIERSAQAPMQTRTQQAYSGVD